MKGAFQKMLISVYCGFWGVVIPEVLKHIEPLIIKATNLNGNKNHPYSHPVVIVVVRILMPGNR